MPVEIYAIILLVLRAVSVYMAVDVIRKQIKLRKRTVRNKEVLELRETMYRETLLILATNIIPIFVDILTVIGMSSRPHSISFESVLYVFSYAITVLLLSRSRQRMYRKALL